LPLEASLLGWPKGTLRHGEWSWGKSIGRGLGPGPAGAKDKRVDPTARLFSRTSNDVSACSVSHRSEAARRSGHNRLRWPGAWAQQQFQSEMVGALVVEKRKGRCMMPLRRPGCGGLGPRALRAGRNWPAKVNSERQGKPAFVIGDVADEDNAGNVIVMGTPRPQPRAGRGRGTASRVIQLAPCPCCGALDGSVVRRPRLRRVRSRRAMASVSRPRRFSGIRGAISPGGAPAPQAAWPRWTW